MSVDSKNRKIVVDRYAQVKQGWIQPERFIIEGNGVSLLTLDISVEPPHEG